MNLTKLLRAQGFDLIDGVDRSQKLLQLWRIRGNDSLQPFSNHINDIFESDYSLNSNPDSSPALQINSTKYDSFAFNIGISVLDDVLKSLTLGQINFNSSNIKGKRVNISYDQAATTRVPISDIEKYLNMADLRNPYSSILKDMNRNNLIVITGLISAKKIIAEIETLTNVTDELNMGINNAVDGNLKFEKISENKIRMESMSDQPFPVAVEAYRIDFDKGEFSKTTRVTDSSFLSRITF